MQGIDARPIFNGARRQDDLERYKTKGEDIRREGGYEGDRWRHNDEQRGARSRDWNDRFAPAASTSAGDGEEAGEDGESRRGQELLSRIGDKTADDAGEGVNRERERGTTRSRSRSVSRSREEIARADPLLRGDRDSDEEDMVLDD